MGSFFPSGTGAKQPSPDPPAARDALERMFRLWRAKRPFVTTEGYLGLGPTAMQQRDEIFVAPGCDVPVVLRLVRVGEHQLIGCCYLQGYLDGRRSPSRCRERCSTLREDRNCLIHASTQARQGLQVEGRYTTLPPIEAKPESSSKGFRHRIWLYTLFCKDNKDKVSLESW